MKKILLCFLFGIPGVICAQSPVTQSAGNGTTIPSSACLACAGVPWNNEANITALDGLAADVSLMQHGFCFQSTCFASRYLSADQFGFSIPSTATALGIEVSITRKATDTMAIKDSVVQLALNGTPGGTIYKASSHWDTSYTTVVYGGPTDLWGSTSGYWTPANINSDIGVLLKVLNDLTVQSQPIFVDHISMTIYFSNTTGTIESQTSSAHTFVVKTIANTISVAGSGTVHIYNSAGELVHMANITQTEPHVVSGLEAGVYFVRLEKAGVPYSKKVIVSEN